MLFLHFLSIFHPVIGATTQTLNDDRPEGRRGDRPRRRRRRWRGRRGCGHRFRVRGGDPGQDPSAGAASGHRARPVARVRPDRGLLLLRPRRRVHRCLPVLVADVRRRTYPDRIVGLVPDHPQRGADDLGAGRVRDRLLRSCASAVFPVIGAALDSARQVDLRVDRLRREAARGGRAGARRVPRAPGRGARAGR